MSNANHADLNPEELDRLLRQARPAHPLPDGFQESVWRRIACSEVLKQPVSPDNWLERWFQRLLAPRLALAGLAAIIAAGVLMGAINAASESRQFAKDRYIASVRPHAIWE